MINEKFFYLWSCGTGLYVLLGLLFLGIFVSPLLITDGLISDILVECIFAMILITGVFATPCSFSLRLGMLIIVFFAVVTRILHKNHHTIFIAKIDNVFAAMSLVAFSLLIIHHFLLNKVSLKHRLVAAVAVYLIFGVLFARLYEIVYLFNPYAFSLDENIDPFSLIYFSFTTLMTLGYGDIVPVSTMARTLAILEGTVGQLYIVILISSLVSEFSTSSITSSKKQDS